MLSVEQIEDIKAQAFAGVPTELEGVCKIYPLTMREILKIGYSQYMGRLGLLLLSETQIQDIVKEKTKQEISIEQINTFRYLISSAQQNDSFLLDLQLVLSTFIKEEVLILPSINSIVVGSPEDKRLLTPDNFPMFQDILRVQNKMKIKPAPPANETAIERKRRLNAEKVAEIKQKQARQSSNGEKSSLVDLLEVASVFGIDWKNESLYAFYSLIKRHQAKEKWDEDIQMLCAGADSSKMNTVYWGENLDKE